VKGLSALVVLALALGAGYLVYQNYATQAGLVDQPPQQQIDVVGVESDLRSMANAERQLMATRGTYATLEELEREGLLVGGTERRGYSYTAQIDGTSGFTITAEPIDPDKADWPTLTIDETMEIVRQ
jgi:hypothetical protein